MKLNFIAKTDIGKKNSNNEDFYALPASKKENPFFILCDGMGGGKAGEVASQLTVKWLLKEFSERNSKENNVLNQVKTMWKKKDISSIQKDITGMIKEVNKKLHSLSQKHEEYKGMGSTLVSVLFEQGHAIIHSVGDSRCYLYRGKKLTQLTEDQSEVWQLYKAGAISKEEMRNHPRNHVLTMAICAVENVEINTVMQPIAANDIYLLCSDRLSDMLSDHEIERILAKNLSLEKRCEKLVEAANEAGGKDNITVMLVEVEKG